MLVLMSDSWQFVPSVKESYKKKPDEDCDEGLENLQRNGFEVVSEEENMTTATK